MRDKRNIILAAAAALLVLIVLFFAFTAGGGNDDDQDAEPTPGTLSLSPSEGPDGTTSTIAVQGVVPGSAIQAKFSDGTPDGTFATDNTNGNGSMPQIFTGSPGDTITVTVTVTRPNGTSYQLAPQTFTITDPNAPKQTTVSLSPTSGPSGTSVVITVNGEPGQPVTVVIDGQAITNFPNTDASGNSSQEHTFNGQDGTTSTVSGTVGSTSGSASFTFDNAPAQPTVTVELSPTEGPSGTTTTITVTGPPNQPVTLSIGGAITNGQTDANGKFTTTHTMNGRVGDKITVEAQVGSTGTGDPKGSAEFTITGATAIEGGPHTFISTTMISRDPGGHGPFVRMLAGLNLFITINSITVDGDDPWVSVTGDIGEDGTFRAEGQGTVAGFPDVTVVFEGQLEGTTLTGEYTMGTAGELPGGEAISYSVEGELDAPDTSEASQPPDFAGFYADFNQAQANGDAAGLLDQLHPAVLERYGADACSTYLASILNPDVTIEFVDATGPETWAYTTDEVATDVDGAYTVTVEVTVGDADPITQDTHLTVSADGEIAWFTDCGEPIAG